MCSTIPSTLWIQCTGHEQRSDPAPLHSCAALCFCVSQRINILSNKSKVFKRTGSWYICSLQMHWSTKALLGATPKVNFSPEGFKPRMGHFLAKVLIFFNWCCCEHVIGENTFRKKESFQHRRALPTCHVTLATAQISLGTGTSYVCFPFGSIWWHSL